MDMQETAYTVTGRSKSLDFGKWSSYLTGDWPHQSHLPLGAAVTEVVVEELLFTAVLLFVVELEILVGPLLPLLLPLLLVLSELDEAITACDDVEDDVPESLPV